jgi:hypothetical protein
VEISIEDTKTGMDLKKAYLDKVGKTNEKIRMFCIGQEIQNSKRLYSYQIGNNFVIIVFFVK